MTLPLSGPTCLCPLITYSTRLRTVLLAKFVNGRGTMPRPVGPTRGLGGGGSAGSSASSRWATTRWTWSRTMAGLACQPWQAQIFSRRLCQICCHRWRCQCCHSRTHGHGRGLLFNIQAKYTSVTCDATLPPSRAKTFTQPWPLASIFRHAARELPCELRRSKVC